MSAETIAEHDVVVLTRDVPAHKLIAGDSGVVVSVHTDASGARAGYLLELFAVDGSTIDVVDVPADAVRPARRSDLSHARAVAAE
jgi:Domain of unknown function (DUF4926)